MAEQTPHDQDVVGLNLAVCSKLVSFVCIYFVYVVLFSYDWNSYNNMDDNIDKGITQFIEIGPGKVLSGLVKRIDKNVKVSAINTEEDIKLININE